MTLNTPYLVYIIGAYGLSFLGLGGLLGWTLFQWMKEA